MIAIIIILIIINILQAYRRAQDKNEIQKLTKTNQILEDLYEPKGKDDDTSNRYY